MNYLDEVNKRPRYYGKPLPKLEKEDYSSP